jgi:hypothetical protein
MVKNYALVVAFHFGECGLFLCCKGREQQIIAHT